MYIKSFYFILKVFLDFFKFVNSVKNVIISKFHDNPTVNEFRIIVLLRQFWVSAGKKKLQCKGYLYQLRHLFRNPNGENVWK